MLHWCVVEKEMYEGERESERGRGKRGERERD